MEERNNMCYGVDMSKEEWKSVKGFEGLYEVSNYGGFKIMAKDVLCRGGGTRHIKEKIRYPNGDEQIQLTKNKKYTYIIFKHLIASIFIPNYSRACNIIFRDENSNNCKLTNIIACIGCGVNEASTVTLNKLSCNINDVPIIQGGFGEGQRVLFDITIANKADIDLERLRNHNIIPNLKNMVQNVDYIDIMYTGNIINYIPLLLELGYTEGTLSQVKHIYIFSERGVAKVMSSLHNSNPAKWQFLNNFVNEYFNMREQIKNQVPQLTKKQQLQLQLFSDDEMEVVSAHKELLKLEVQEATAPLIETIEKQAPKVDKFERYMESDGTYNATNTAKLLNISSAQKFNNLLKDEKIQYRSGKNWVLYSKYQWLIDEGYCKYIEGENSNYSYIQLRWFPKGVDWLRTQIQEQVI